MLEKVGFREKIKAMRAGMPKEEWLDLSRKLQRHLSDFIRSANFSRIFAFRSALGEPDINPLTDQLRSEYEIFLPVITGKSSMDFCLYSSNSKLILNKFGIEEPEAGKKVDFLTEDDLILVPGLAFSFDGNRLGFGGGFYDRYLSTHLGYRLGVCFQRFFYDDIPSNEYDRSMNGLCSECGVLIVENSCG